MQQFSFQTVDGTKPKIHGDQTDAGITHNVKETDIVQEEIGVQEVQTVRQSQHQFTKKTTAPGMKP